MTAAAPTVSRPGLGLGFGGRWTRFALRRGGRLLVSLFVLVTAAFLMIHLVPGDPVRAALGMTAPAELVEARRQELGLDDPLLTQYLHYLGGLFRGDLGESIQTQLPVGETIGRRLGATVSLGLLAFALALLVAVPLGVAVAVATRRGRRQRTALGFSSTSVVLGSIPDFLVGVILVAVFAVGLGWFPVAGRADGAASYVLPVLALSIGPAAVLARIVRVEMIAVLESDYVRTARAKRLPARRIHLVHALPNAVTATLTLGGMLLAAPRCSTRSAWRCQTARSSAWSVSPGRASRPSPRRPSDWCRSALVGSPSTTFRQVAAPGPDARGSRWSSRTPTPPSTRG